MIIVRTTIGHTINQGFFDAKKTIHRLLKRIHY